MRRSASFVRLLVLCVLPCFAQVPQEGVQTDDLYASGDFLQYKPYIRPSKPIKKEEKTAPPAETTKKPKSKEELVTMEWLKKNYEKLNLRSMNDPTEENLLAEIAVRRIVFDKAQNYANKLVEKAQSDPYLDENNRVPYSTAGSTALSNAQLIAQDNAVREMAKSGGLLVFVDGTCRFCAMQMPLIEMLKKEFGLEALVISLDGASPAGFKGQVLKDNGLYHKLTLKLTPSIVFVNQPKGYLNGLDPNEYAIVAQGYNTLPDLVKHIAFAGYRRNYLSAELKKDLNVWNRGVSTTEDLNQLTLDVDNPKSIYNKVIPLLGKGYDQ